MEAVNILSKMETTTNVTHWHLKQKKKQRFLCPLNHSDKKGMKEKHEIREIPIASQYGIQAAGLQSEPRSQSLTVRRKPDAETTSNTQMLCLLREMHSSLISDVYDQVSIDVIHDTKLILDLPTFVVRLHQSDVGSICSGKQL